MNAKIESVSLGIEGHGIMSGLLVMRSGSSSQGFGGYNLNDPECLGVWIRGVMKALKVEDWGKVVGQFCRVEREDQDGMIIGIGHIVDDEWFYPGRVFKAMAEEGGVS